MKTENNKTQPTDKQAIAFDRHVSESLFLAAENNLTNEERMAVRVLNFIAEFDGIILEESEREYLLKKGIEKFIPEKRQHLVAVTETAYPIRIKVAKK